MNLQHRLTSIRHKLQFFSFLKTLMWFSLGSVIGLFFFSSFVYIYYRETYKNKIYPGVTINHVDFGGKTKEDVRKYFSRQNQVLQSKRIQFMSESLAATVSARQIGLGFDENLLASQAYSIGRSDSFFSDVYLSLESYLHGITLSPAYHYSDKEVERLLKKFQARIDVPPVDARFKFENGRVTEFNTAKDGKKVEVEKIKEQLQEKIVPTLATGPESFLTIQVPIKVLKPDLENNEANSMGITERIGIGTSLFHGSIPNREYNLSLASSRLNGVLIKPDEVFSFAKAVGDVSSLTGYKQAYVIENGRTVLGDGGGVCQVSTTLFRAILNAGLPVVERHPHAYRVHYYEEDLGPGIDAAVYVPSVDLKFKNNTGHYILIQASVNLESKMLTFELYGTYDGRVATISKPVILSQSPAPEALYQDDPTLPVGQVKQVDWAAPGANVYFTYTVTRNGKEITSDKFSSYYRPWQAVFLKGTKEG